MKQRQSVSLIAPMYNEQEVIEIFFNAVEQHLGPHNIDYEIICINDGSIDDTFTILKRYAKKDTRIKIVNFSRNFGKEIALSAGIDFANNDCIVPIDCDLQDPPELIVDMFNEWQAGYDVVLAKRNDRSSDSYIKRTTSSLFYKLIVIVP